MGTATIQIKAETKKRISVFNYTSLPGTKRENILCALIVNLCVSTKPISAQCFLDLYNWLVGTLYQGIVIDDFDKRTLIKNSTLLEEAYSLKGDETENLVLKLQTSFQMVIKILKKILIFVIANWK